MPREFNTTFELLGTNTNVTSSYTYVNIEASHSNPGDYSVPGTVFAAAQVSFTVSPTVFTAATVTLNLDYALDPHYDPPKALVPGTKFTCAIYGNSTLIGSASATIPTGGFIGCHGVYGTQLDDETGASIAEVPLPNTFDTSKTYTTLFGF